MASYNQLDEAELLLLLKEGDSCAFNELYERTWYSLYKAAYKRLRDKETCKDVIHDVYADLWNKRHVKEIESLLPYLHTSVRNKIYTLTSKGQFTAHFIEPFESMGVSSLNADSWFQFSELQKLVEVWMRTLPVKRRKIFQLKYTENLSTREIGQQLNISQKTVQNQLLTAFNDLQGYLGHYLTLLLILRFII